MIYFVISRGTFDAAALSLWVCHHLTVLHFFVPKLPSRFLSIMFFVYLSISIVVSSISRQHYGSGSISSKIDIIIIIFEITALTLELVSV